MIWILVDWLFNEWLMAVRSIVLAIANGLAGCNPVVSRPRTSAPSTQVALLPEDDGPEVLTSTTTNASAVAISQSTVRGMLQPKDGQGEGAKGLFYFKVVSNNLKGKTIQGSSLHLANVDVIVQQYDFVTVVAGHGKNKNKTQKTRVCVIPRAGSLLALCWLLGLTGLRNSIEGIYQPGHNINLYIK